MSGAEAIVTRKGRCLCGACAFEAPFQTAKDGALRFGACHCGMCRRWAGGPLLALTAAGPARFENEDAVGIYKGSDWAERGFCKSCGAGLFWRSRDDSHWVIPLGLLEDQSDLVFASEIYIDCKPAFYAFAGDRKTMTEAEVIAAFAPKT